MQPTPARLEAEQMLAIAGLTAAIEIHDVGLPGESAQVADLASAIATQMRLDPNQVLILARAALLHDLGKLGLPSSVLTKAEELSESDHEVIRKHPSLGLEILTRIGDMQREKAIILAHHEHFDGSGYPNHLSGDQIILEARVLAVADAYVSMLADRPWRRGLGSQRSLEDIGAASGSGFDPKVVDALVEIVKSEDSPAPPSEANRRRGLFNRRIFGPHDRRARPAGAGA